jgi:hypothetical protein
MNLTESAYDKLQSTFYWKTSDKYFTIKLMFYWN